MSNEVPKELTVEEAKAKKAAAIEARKNGGGVAIKDYDLAATSISDFTGPNRGVPEDEVQVKPVPPSGPEAAIAAKNAKAEAARKKEQAEALKKAEEEEAAKIAEAKAKLAADGTEPAKVVPPAA